MATWMTVSEISARYIVGEQKLLEFARRGSMPMVRRGDGVTLFDESFAGLVFRPRSAGRCTSNLGVLGLTRIGETKPTSTPELSVRRAHRRGLRSPCEVPEARLRKAG